MEIHVRLKNTPVKDSIAEPAIGDKCRYNELLSVTCFL